MVLQRLARQLTTPSGEILGVAVFLLVAAAAFPRLLSPYDPIQIQGTLSMRAPTWGHTLGTDLLGKDVLSQIIYGTRTTLLIGASAVLLSLVAGTLIGLVSGFWGGSMLDETLMRLIDALYIFPDLILALTIVAILGPGRIESVIIALAIGHVAAYARLVRSRVLALRGAEFVAAARSLGASANRILVRHILPQTTDVLVVRSVIALSSVVLGEAALSFLGLGVQPPTPSWGRMLRDGFQYLATAPWVAFSPGFAIFLTVFLFNHVGEMIRDVLDPHALMARTPSAAARRPPNPTRPMGDATPVPTSKE